MSAARRPALAVLTALAASLGLLALAPACTDEQILLANLPPRSDGGPGADPTKCVDDTECPAQAFCSRAQCDDIGGACELRPIVCGDEPMPVCGCDGVTYWNDCLRRTAGITAMTPGECTANARPCGEQHGSPGGSGSCPLGASCARLLPPLPDGPGPMPGPMPPFSCPPDIRGTCWALPAVCPPSFGTDRWIACESHPPGCFATCDAIRTGAPFRRARACP